jgi:hypothetical protein
MMSTNKILVAGIVGGIIFFLLGWLVYGILLMDFMTANAGPGAASIQKEPMEMWALVVSNLAWGFLFAIIFGRWTNTSKPKDGLIKGAIIALLVALFIDMSMYSMCTFITMKTMLADIAAMTVNGAIAGALIAMVLGMGGKSQG